MEKKTFNVAQAAVYLELGYNELLKYNKKGLGPTPIDPDSGTKKYTKRSLDDWYEGDDKQEELPLEKVNDYWPLVNDVPCKMKIKWDEIKPLLINGKRCILEEMEVDQSFVIENASYEKDHMAIYEQATKLWVVPKMLNEGKNLRVWRVA